MPLIQSPPRGKGARVGGRRSACAFRLQSIILAAAYRASGGAAAHLVTYSGCARLSPEQGRRTAARLSATLRRLTGDMIARVCGAGVRPLRVPPEGSASHACAPADQLPGRLCRVAPSRARRSSPPSPPTPEKPRRRVGSHARGWWEEAAKTSTRFLKRSRRRRVRAGGVKG